MEPIHWNIWSERENNLKYFSSFSAERYGAVTGVSGSKSTLISKILYPTLKKQMGGYADKTGAFDLLKGDYKNIRAIEFIDQNPIGKPQDRILPHTWRPTTKTGKLLGRPDAIETKQFLRPHTSLSISMEEDVLNAKEREPYGWRCTMADIVLLCDHCKGKRFKEEILEVKYLQHNVHDLLDMTVNQAIELFRRKKEPQKTNCTKNWKPLADVGLGYIKLGQSSNTLSGGESQRVKLASFLANEKSNPTLFIFDEPTTGLHFNDIKKLLAAFSALIENGHCSLLSNITWRWLTSRLDHWFISEGGQEEKWQYGILKEHRKSLVHQKNSYTN